MTEIHDIPKVPTPSALMCWKQQIDPTKPAMLYHCTYPVGHAGPHQWEPKP